MVGNHQVLVGPYHISADPAGGRADAVAVLLVGRFVEIEPQPGASSADSAPHWRRMLADAGREDDAVKPPERSGKRRNMARDAVAKQLDGKAGAGLSLAKSSRKSDEIPDRPSMPERL